MEIIKILINYLMSIKMNYNVVQVYGCGYVGLTPLYMCKEIFYLRDKLFKLVRFA